MRYQAPLAHLPLRYAGEGLDLDGIHIPKGDAILVSYAAAGRDPGLHSPDADEFDPDRSTRAQHLAFGYGVHHCLGAPLARLEAQIALPARFPALRLAVEPSELRPVPSFVSDGRARLPVCLV